MKNFERVLDMLFEKIDNDKFTYDYLVSENRRLSEENKQLKDELEAMKKAALPCDPELISSSIQNDYTTKGVSSQ